MLDFIRFVCYSHRIRILKESEVQMMSAVKMSAVKMSAVKKTIVTEYSMLTSVSDR